MSMYALRGITFFLPFCYHSYAITLTISLTSHMSLKSERVENILTFFVDFIWNDPKGLQTVKPLKHN